MSKNGNKVDKQSFFYQKIHFGLKPAECSRSDGKTTRDSRNKTSRQALLPNADLTTNNVSIFYGNKARGIV